VTRDSGCEVQDARRSMSYRDLEIWKLARQIAIAVHRMTLQNLPKFEMYEEASQIRRSAKSISANIVEGYGRRRYKQEFIRFLVFAHASCDETIEHLQVLFETGSLTNEDIYRDLSTQLDLLGRKFNVFIDSVERLHRTDRRDIPDPESRIAHLAS
jgi:four helix bundle protein